ncbi:MAG: ComF family protein [Anaerolineales bacterium]|nr:ComF family protein [Anaerolineales bacterium]
MNWKYSVYHSFWKMLDLLFPPVCGGCGKQGSSWCVDCQKRVNILEGILCEICGLPQDKPGVCPTCFAEKPHFRALRAWAVFSDPVRPALHRLKYRRDVSMGDAFAAQMVPFVKALNWQIDLVIPIPLGRQRLKERGYNQVGMIAKPLALALGMRYAPNGLMRRKETRSQVGLTRNERKANVRNAFQAGTGVNGKSVLIMDDVSTTGSTLSAGAEALYSAGARDVYALTVARALPQHGLMHA